MSIRCLQIGCVPYNLDSGVVYEYTCGRCNSSYYGETERHLKVRSGEHIGISPLIFKTTKLSKERSVCEHLLQCDNNPSFDEFNILTHGNKKYLLREKFHLSVVTYNKCENDKSFALARPICTKVENSERLDELQKVLYAHEYP